MKPLPEILGYRLGLPNGYSSYKMWRRGAVVLPANWQPTDRDLIEWLRTQVDGLDLHAEGDYYTSLNLFHSRVGMTAWVAKTRVPTSTSAGTGHIFEVAGDSITDCLEQIVRLVDEYVIPGTEP